jgi:hypothetical protein
VAKDFYENTMPPIHVFFEEFVLSLKTITLSDYDRNVGTFIHTFPPVLERLGIWSVGGPSSLGSSIPGDHARFFEGDALREGAAGCSESLTGTCVIFLPRRVCVIVTSNISGFDPVSLIFGMERIGYAAIAVSGHKG